MTGASVVGVTVVTDGVGIERQEQAVESALDAKVVNAAGMVGDEVGPGVGLFLAVVVDDFVVLLVWGDRARFPIAGPPKVVAVEAQVVASVSVLVTVTVEVCMMLV